MTVKRLIAELEKYPPYYNVVYPSGGVLYQNVHEVKEFVVDHEKERIFLVEEDDGDWLEWEDSW